MGSLLLIAVVVFIATIHHAMGGSAESLFTNDPAVIDLTSEKVEEANHAAGNCPWIVLFYNSYCGHCRNYAPKYAKFATHLSKQSPVLVGAVNCVTQREACGRMQIHGVPAVFMRGVRSNAKYTAIGDIHGLDAFAASAEKSAKLSPDQLNECVAMKAQFLAAKSGGEAKPPAGDGGLPAARRKRPIAFQEETQLHVGDIAGAFLLTLRDEVPMSASLDRNVLTGFLRAVDRSVPSLGAGDILSSLPAAEADFKTATWTKVLVDAKIPFTGTSTEVAWKKCKGSSPKYRGLPCGLWSLYHTMVANAPPTEAAATLHAIRAYIAHYFTCTACRDHFLAMDFNVAVTASDDEALLWLWQAHNQANQRLAQSGESNDPFVPKVQWPTRQACLSCFQTMGIYDKNGVAQYLRQVYALTSIVGALKNGAQRPIQNNSRFAVGKSLPTTSVETLQSAVMIRPVDALHKEQDENKSVAFTLMVLVFVFVGAASWLRGRRSVASSAKFGKK